MIEFHQSLDSPRHAFHQSKQKKTSRPVFNPTAAFEPASDPRRAGQEPFQGSRLRSTRILSDTPRSTRAGRVASSPSSPQTAYRNLGAGASALVLLSQPRNIYIGHRQAHPSVLLCDLSASTTHGYPVTTMIIHSPTRIRSLSDVHQSKVDIQTGRTLFIQRQNCASLSGETKR